MRGPFAFRAGVDAFNKIRYDQRMVNSYIIHLKRSTRRKPLVDALLDNLPSPRVIDAVDGHALEEADVSAILKDQIVQPKYPFGVMPGELGCFLSHRNVWGHVANGKHNVSLIAEDDTILSPNFAESLDVALECSGPDTLIRFPVKNREKKDQLIHSADTIEVFRPQEIGLTTTMYLLGKNAAKMLLNNSQFIDRPIDVWLQLRWETKVDSYTIWPSNISSAPLDFGGSTIQKKQKSLVSKVKRSVARSRYRSSISKLSKIS